MFLGNPNLELINIPYGTPEWFEFRKTGIGGSEIGILLGLLDKYSSQAQLFHEKVGTVEAWKEDNEAMFWGRALEKEVADKWQYWDGDVNSYIHNYADKIKIRTCSIVDGFIVNKKFPWLFISVDRLIDKEGGFSLITRETLTKLGVLEIKTIEERTAALWAAGIPPYYIAQVNQYMLVLEVDYAELAILENGRRLSVVPFQRSENLCRAIVNHAQVFWEQRVEPAKKALMYAQKFHSIGDHAKGEYYDGLIQHYEPDPTPGESYKQFMAERFTKKREEVEMDPKTLVWATYHKTMHELMKYFENEKSRAENILIKTFKDKGVEWIKTSKRGYVRYYTARNQKVPRLDNRLRMEVNKEKFALMLRNIDLNLLQWTRSKARLRAKDEQDG